MTAIAPPTHLAGPRRRGGLGQVLTPVAHGLLWTFVAAIGALITVAVLVPRIGGATPYTILTSSMEPELPPGTLVVVRPTPVADIEIGDVVTYQLRSGRSEVVTHRVVAIGEDGGGRPLLRTQGDANDVADPGWVRPLQVRGTLWYDVPYAGRADQLLSASQRHLATLIVAAGLFGYAGLMWLGAFRDRRAR